MSADTVKADDKVKKKAKFVVRTLTDPSSLCHVDTWISTQNVALDYVLGGKGLPVRRVVECYGDNSTGKSLLAAALCSEVQRMGGIAAYADCEIAQYPERLESLGIDNSKLLYCNPKTIADVFEALREFIKWRNDNYGKAVPLLFAWDSLAAITTMAMLERASSDGDENKAYPDVARVLSQTFSREINTIAEENVLMFITNQTRSKLGLFVGDGVATTGGEAVKFYSSIRIELETRAKLKNGNEIIGANVLATPVKNRFAPPYRSVLIPVYYAYGMDECEATFNLLLDKKLIAHEKGSPWYAVKFGEDEVKFQKKGWLDLFTSRTDEVIALLNTNSAVAEEV